MKKLIFSLIAVSFLFTSCETEELSLVNEIANHTVTINQNKSVNGNIIVNRTRIKQKKRKNYNSIIIVNDPINNVAAIDVQVQPMNNIQPSPSNYLMDPLGNEGENKRFVFNQLNFENGTVNGWPFKQISTPVDANGEPAGETVEQWVTVEDNDGVDMKYVKVKRLADQQNVLIEAKYRASSIEDVANAIFYINEITGNNLSVKDKTIPVENVEMVVTNVDGSGNTGTVDVIIIATIEVTYETASGQKPFENRQNVGVNIELLSPEGELVDDDLFYVDIEDEIVTPVVFVKNSSHKIKLNGNHRIRVKLKGQEAAAAHVVTVAVPSGFSDGAPQLVNLYRTQNSTNTNPVFLALQAPMNNVLHGMVYNGTTTIYDIEGNVLAEEVIEFTVEETQQPEGITLQNIRLKRNGEEDTYTLRLKLIGENRTDVARVDVFLTPLDGGSEADPEEFDLFKTNQTDFNITFKNTVVEFDDPDGVVSMQYSVEYTLENADGDELSYMEEILFAEN